MRTYSISTSKGFTLIEVLVSMAIFITAVSLGVLAVTSMDAASKRIRVKDQSVQSAYFLIDSLSRSIRMGKKYNCLGTLGNELGPESCSTTMAAGFGYTDQDGRGIKIMYRDIGNGYGVFHRKIGNDTPVKLHDEYALKMKNAGFYIDGAGNDSFQPYVSIRMLVEYSYKGKSYTIPLQTTLTQRELDRASAASQ